MKYLVGIGRVLIRAGRPKKCGRLARVKAARVVLSGKRVGKAQDEWFEGL